MNRDAFPPELIAKAKEEFLSSQDILLTTHVRPDGDAIGSLLGMGLALKEAGKKVQMVSEDGVPPPYRKLDEIHNIRTRRDNSCELLIVLDCSDASRSGALLADGLVPGWNIDHHITNDHFARLNFIFPQAVATAEIVAALLLEFGLPISPSVASALLTGLVTDTIGFQTSNITPSALRLVADLMEKGADLPGIYRNTLTLRSFQAVRFWASGLAQLEKEQRMVWATLTQEARRTAGYSGRDDADLIQVLASIEEADIALIFVEQPNGRIKVSWRSQPGFDVSKIALKFGGGGHPSASGVDISGSLDEVRSLVLPATRTLLERNGNE
jgi:bifunctional oligoribonuclease and PAP phosphatase NrnA